MTVADVFFILTLFFVVFGYHNNIKCCLNTPSSVSYILSRQQNASLCIQSGKRVPKGTKNEIILVKRLLTKRKCFRKKFAYAAADEAAAEQDAATDAVLLLFELLLL